MTPLQTFNEAEAASIIKHLERRGMEGYYCSTSKEAVEKALSFMEKGASISWGGSETLKECGIMDAIRTADFKLIDRDTEKKNPGTDSSYETGPYRRLLSHEQQRHYQRRTAGKH